MDKKKVSESALVDQVHPVFPLNMNANDTVFGGFVMALLDQVALVVAERHSERTCVTASVDAMHFLAPAHRGDNLIICAAINRTWNSSMEIGLKVEAQNPKSRKNIHIVSAYYTFVAIDSNGKPIPVSELALSTQAEKRRFEEAQLRRTNRVKQAAELKKIRDSYN
ncbi:MAG: acyl-CoA thioesterase [Simkaniaceae bacterium]|nr:acyl-CoA thioesterase [Simkaniaceae bacterium]